MVRGRQVEMGDANENPASWKRSPIAESSGAGDGWSRQANGATHCEKAIHVVDQDLRSFSENLVQDLIDKAVLFL